MRRGSLPVCLCAAAQLAESSCGLFVEEDEMPLTELPEPPRIAQSVTYPVQRTDIHETIEGWARATPIRRQSLYFTTTGRIGSVGVDPEEAVTRGEIMATLEIDDLRYQLAREKIDQEIANTILEQLRLTGAPSTEIRVQELVVEKHNLAVAHLENRVEAATLRAPFDGVVERVQANVSDLVQEYESIIEVSDPTTLELQMEVSPDHFYAIDRSMRAEVEIEDDSWVPADIVQLTHLDPRRDATVRREQYTVHLVPSNPQLELSLHDRMQTRIIVEEEVDTLVIPAAGLREFGGRTYVRVLEGEVRREVDVSVGIRTDTHVEIETGVSEGDLVLGK